MPSKPNDAAFMVLTAQVSPGLAVFSPWFLLGVRGPLVLHISCSWQKPLPLLSAQRKACNHDMTNRPFLLPIVNSVPSMLSRSANHFNATLEVFSAVSYTCQTLRSCLADFWRGHRATRECPYPVDRV